MFRSASIFNSNIGNWNTARVTDMSVSVKKMCHVQNLDDGLSTFFPFSFFILHYFYFYFFTCCCSLLKHN